MATANSSISGLVSGLDTASIIDQLMQLEAIPQARLQTQQSVQKKVLAALQSVNTDVSLLGSKAASLADPKTWTLLEATSSGSSVSASVTDESKATPTSFSVRVDQVATTSETLYGTAAKLADAVTTSSTVTLNAADGKAYNLSVGGGTLQELADAINAKRVGVTATTVRTGTDTYKLQLTADTVGAASKITLTGLNTALGVENAVAGQGAQITIGSMGLTSTSNTNTFTNLVPGVDLTLAANAKQGDTATISVANDSSSVKNAVSALVDQLNKVLDSIDTQSANSSTTAAAGVLSGDSTVRDVRNRLAETLFGSDNSSMATYGIETDKYGKLVFDGAAFDKAFATDPTDVMNHFTSAVTTAVAPAVNHSDGWAARVVAATKAASDSVTGMITTDITGTNSTIDELAKNIAGWNDRLALRRTTLQNTYTALETALSSLQSQGQWLAGQISSLPKMSS